MAQVIDSNLRQPIQETGNGEANRFNGTITVSNQLRLKQNNTSKIVLQALLATMLVCGIAVYALRDMGSTLQHNPCSIAGVMSLLAGSEMCERTVMPEGAEFMSDRKLGEALRGYLFSLGWWAASTRAGSQRAKRFGIDIGKAEVDPGRRMKLKRFRWKR